MESFEPTGRRWQLPLHAIYLAGEERATSNGKQIPSPRQDRNQTNEGQVIQSQQPSLFDYYLRPFCSEK
jgi:hypothetical protein